MAELSSPCRAHEDKQAALQACAQCTLHRGLYQLTGSEKCQCRLARAQRNHLACCYHAWASLKVKAKELGQTRYELRSGLFSDYLRVQPRNPRMRPANLAERKS